MKEPSLFEAGCPRIEVAICLKSSSVMSGRNRLLTCDKSAFDSILFWASILFDDIPEDKENRRKERLPNGEHRKPSLA
jgi:hypothetical protein